MPRNKTQSVQHFFVPIPTFTIDIRPDCVDVRLDASTTSPRRRFYALACYVAFTLMVEAARVFLPGKHGSSSIAHDISSHPLNSSLLRFGVIILLGVNAFIVFIVRRALLGFFPSDERLHCDAHTLTLSKVRWLDITNTQWQTRTFDLSEISEVSFAMIAPDRYRSVHGIRLLIRGKKVNTLPGLNPRQAGKVLDGLQDLGVDLKETYRLKARKRKLLKLDSRDPPTSTQ